MRIYVLRNTYIRITRPYNKVQNSLYNYISEVQSNNTINTNSIAGKVCFPEIA